MIRRILHVVGPMDRGGVESWLMQLLRRIERTRYRMDFLVRGEQAGAFDQEIRDFGSRVIACAGHRNPWLYARSFADALQCFGPYHVVHAHLNRYNGMIMRLAARGGVPLRIAHSHSDRRRTDEEGSLSGRAYLSLMRRWIDRYATFKVAVSRGAAEYLYGPSWAERPNTLIIHCGLDVAEFAASHDRRLVRGALGIPSGALVLGHVGRFVPEKNQAFVLNIAEAAMALEPRLWVLLVGTGPLQAATVDHAQTLGIANKVIFAGPRADVPALMQAAMDVFVLPSVFEGLPMALVEAQAAGLGCIVSDRVTGDADLIKPLIRRLSLDAPTNDWALAVIEAIARRPIARAAALARVGVSDFNIERSLLAITQLYEGRA